MSSQVTSSAPRKITLGLIIGWALGIFLLLPAISMLAKQPVTGLALLAASLVLLPPAIGFIQKKGNFHLSGGVKFIVVVVLLGVAVGTMDRSQLSVAEQAAQPSDTQPAAAQAPTATKSYQEVFVFKGNGAKKSEPFTITGDKFKIAYNCSGSLCQAWLKKPEGGFSFEIIMNGTGPINDESIFYKAGTYYIESNSIGTYTMTVQDYR
jgi:hypothetical protein